MANHDPIVHRECDAADLFSVQECVQIWVSFAEAEVRQCLPDDQTCMQTSPHQSDQLKIALLRMIDDHDLAEGPNTCAARTACSRAVRSGHGSQVSSAKRWFDPVPRLLQFAAVLLLTSGLCTLGWIGVHILSGPSASRAQDAQLPHASDRGSASHAPEFLRTVRDDKAPASELGTPELRPASVLTDALGPPWAPEVSLLDVLKQRHLEQRKVNGPTGAELIASSVACGEGWATPDQLDRAKVFPAQVVAEQFNAVGLLPASGDASPATAEIRVFLSVRGRFDVARSPGGLACDLPLATRGGQDSTSSPYSNSVDVARRVGMETSVARLLRDSLVYAAARSVAVGSGARNQLARLDDYRGPFVTPWLTSLAIATKEASWRDPDRRSLADLLQPSADLQSLVGGKGSMTPTGGAALLAPAPSSCAVAFLCGFAIARRRRRHA